ncbi:hypothetical protein J8F10_06760 [Gemmata sp. G18]|uniref:Uncharacterized protein n=1 Tax=Gemmata palustris TaxID=2822762 RepID=A0ABS5BMP9_9BACT|nr:hypothetical protein [Gemmata palustris]MBP3954981.1 hypothetical protein [Gemmata palustris]
MAATPRITAPLANAFVLSGADLTVTVTTNRSDLRYKVVFTPIPAPPGPTTTSIPANGGGGFTLVIPGASLQPNCVYEIHVFVDPADGGTPPHLDHAINVHTNPPPGMMVVRQSLSEDAV